MLAQGRWVSISSKDLLPGDICSIGSSKGNAPAVYCPADVLLLRGSCIVNEAMLTGESVPLMKEGLEVLGSVDASEPLAAFDGSDKRHAGHVVFSGTQVHTCVPVWGMLHACVPVWGMLHACVPV